MYYFKILTVKKIEEKQKNKEINSVIIQRLTYLIGCLLMNVNILQNLTFSDCHTRFFFFSNAKEIGPQRLVFQIKADNAGLCH